MNTATYDLLIDAPRHTRAWLLRRCDLQAAACLILVLLAYGVSMFVLSKASPSELAVVTSEYFGLAYNAAVLAGCACAAICLVRPDTRPRMLVRLFWLLVAGVLVGLLFPFFGMFKQLVLPSRGFLWDRTFAHFGRLVFGVSPWTLTHKVFGGVEATIFLDRIYTSWMVLMVALPFAASILFDDPRRRLQILLSWLLAWILIGTVAAWFFSSAGPCYYNNFVGPDADYARLVQHLGALGREAAAAGHPLAALQFQPELLQSYRGADLRLAGGISAMPSMHVALATLMTLTAFAKARWLGFLFVAYSLLIWIGSVHFGWHYIVDGPIAALMMTGIWSFSRAISERFYPDRQPAAPAITVVGACVTATS